MATVEVETGYEHVVVDSKKGAFIVGTTMKVIQLVMERMAYGWSPEELHFQHPHLTLGQIYSALAYYWDHRDELDVEIESSLDISDDLRRKSGPSPLVARLRSEGLL